MNRRGREKVCCEVLCPACAHRLRTSSVLVVGVRGLGAELCKNIVLAGVRSVTVLDSEPLGPEDAGGRFLGRTEGENVSHPDR